MNPASLYRLGVAGATHPALTFEQPHYPLPDPHGLAGSPPTDAQTIGLQAAAGIRLVVRPTTEQAWRDIPNGCLDGYVAGHADTTDLDRWVVAATVDQLAAVWVTAIAAADRWYARDRNHRGLQT